MLKETGLLCWILFLVTPLVAQSESPRKVHYQESKVPGYTLPDPLKMEDGSEVVDPGMWWEQRRPEILELFREQIYGRDPVGAPSGVQYHLLEEGTAFGGSARRKQIQVRLGKKGAPTFDLLIYLPLRSAEPIPLFLTLNFYGNQSIAPDPAIVITDSWCRNQSQFGIKDHRATEKSRGSRQERWAVQRILDRGYGLATIYYGDLDPDYDDGFQNGVHGYFDGEKERSSAAWGSIAGWAWGLSRALDYLETDDQIDHQRVAVMGHSRLGKTALWAAAVDQRFALVISNNSGCGGAALSMRQFGETVHKINHAMPHWFCQNFQRYNDQERLLPVDQHQLISLIAPRPVYIASAVEDRWADPHGEFLAGLHANPVYHLLGKEGLPVGEMPELDRPIHGTIGYHLRRGKHDVTPFDWEMYLDFADQNLGTSDG